MILFAPRFLRIFGGKHVTAMALFPFILIKNQEVKDSTQTINHEKIHHRQQLELLILPFYILYGLFYLYYLIKYRNGFNAYMSIPFEREAYAMDSELNYLSNRKWYSWMKYID